MLKIRFIQNGFSLIELMVSMSLGIVLLGGVIGIFSSTVSNNTESLQTARLQHELRATMAIMQNDIRRAGYWSNALSTFGANNPFTTAAADLKVLDGGTCILYTYDLNKNGAIDTDTEYFGFRLNGNKVEMRINGSTTADCHVADSEWEAVTDSSVITIDALMFDSSSYVCTNLTDATDINCSSPATDDITQTIRQIEISVTGHVSNNAVISRSMVDSVRVRNDRLQKI